MKAGGHVSTGFDAKVLRQIVRLRKMDAQNRRGAGRAVGALQGRDWDGVMPPSAVAEAVQIQAGGLAKFARREIVLSR